VFKHGLVRAVKIKSKTTPLLPNQVVQITKTESHREIGFFLSLVDIRKGGMNKELALLFLILRQIVQVLLLITA
jgi:hypothetical protein